MTATATTTPEEEKSSIEKLNDDVAHLKKAVQESSLEFISACASCAFSTAVMNSAEDRENSPLINKDKKEELLAVFQKAADCAADMLDNMDPKTRHEQRVYRDRIVKIIGKVEQDWERYTRPLYPPKSAPSLLDRLFG